MAAILVSPTDIVHKRPLQRRGRPSKPELEKRRRQQEAYKWRDARRVYLARSFDRWKRLRGRLKMKDSSLAWHLMEAHDSYCMECGRDCHMQPGSCDGGANLGLQTGSMEAFKKALVSSLRQLCHKHFCFSVSMEVMGLVCLDIDKGRSEHFSIAETVRPVGRASNTVGARDHVNGLPPLNSMNADSSAVGEEAEENVSDVEMENCGGRSSADSETYDIGHSPRKKMRLDNSVSRENKTDSYARLVLDSVRDHRLRSSGMPSTDGRYRSAACNKAAGQSFAAKVLPSSPVVISEDEASVPDSSIRSAQPDDERSASCQAKESESRDSSRRIFPMEKTDSNVKTMPPSLPEGKPETCASQSDCSSHCTSHSSVLSACKGVDSEAQIETPSSSSLTAACSASSSTTSFAMSSSSALSPSNSSSTTSASTANSSSTHAAAPDHCTIPSSTSTVADPSIFGKSLSQASSNSDDACFSQVVQLFEAQRSGPLGTEEEMLCRNPDLGSRTLSTSPTESLSRKTEISQAPCSGGDASADLQSQPASSVIAAETSAEEVVRAEDDNTKVSSGGVNLSDQRKLTEEPCQTSSTEEPHCEASPSSPHHTVSSCISPHNETVKNNLTSDLMHPNLSPNSSREKTKSAAASASETLPASLREEALEKGARSTPDEDLSVFVTFASGSRHEKMDITEEEASDVDDGDDEDDQGTGSPLALDLSSRSSSVPQPQPTLVLHSSDEEQEEAMDFSLNKTARSFQSDCRPRSAPSLPQQPSGREGLLQARTPASTGSGWSSESGRLSAVKEEPSTPSPKELDLSIVKKEPPAGNDGDCRRTTPAPRPSPSPRMSFTPGQSDEDSSNTNALDLLGRCVNNSILAVAGTSPGKKRKHTEQDPAGPSSSSCHRRELVYRMEHEYLELNPYLDFSEFSRKFEHVQQRTFYRWKKRIKEEYMFLEKNLTLSYEDFCKYFPHTKEHVFIEWKKLIQAGCRFGAVTSTDLSSLSGSGSQGAMSEVMVEQSKLMHLLQVNPHLTFDKFSRLHPEVPKEVFVYWQKHIHHLMAILEANPGMTYAEFQQTAPMISREIYEHWQYILNSPEPLVTQQLSRHEAGVSLGSGASLPGRRAGEGFRGFPSWSLGSKDSSRSLPHSTVSHLDLPSSISTADFLKTSSFVSSGKDLGLDKTASSLSLWETAANMSKLYLEPGLRFPSLQAVSRQAEASASIARLAQLSPDAFRPGQSDTRSATQSASRPGASSQSERGQASSAQSLVPGLTLRTSPMLASSAMNFQEEDEQQVTAQLDFFSKSRKQNKAEYYHYLQNPDLDFGELSALFPMVSLRTFYRWKKEIRSAFLFMGENPDADYEVFKVQFPEIPMEIFKLWREKYSHLKKSLDDSTGHCLPPPPPPLLQTQSAIFSPAAPPPLPQRKSPLDLEMAGRPDDVGIIGDLYSQGISRKQNKGEFQMLQLNPSIDFAEFNTMFPHISMRTFYRWRKEIKDAMTILRDEGDISLSEFQKIYPEITEEVYSVWQAQLKKEREVLDSSDDAFSGASQLMQNYLQGRLDASAWGYLGDPFGHAHPSSLGRRSTSPHNLPSEDRDEALNLSDKSGSRLLVNNNNHFSHVDSDNEPSMSLNHLRFRKQTKPEYVFLQLNPLVEFTVFNASYPDTGMRTYYRWKKEINEALDIMRSRPDITFAELTSFYPELSKEVFKKWQKMVTTGSLCTLGAGEVSEVPPPSTSGASLPVSSKDEEIYVSTGKKHNKAEYYFVCKNPNIDFLEFSKTFNTVSQRTFYRWKKEIRESLMLEEDGEALLGAGEHEVMDLTPGSSFSLPASSSSSSSSLHASATAFTSSPAVFPPTIKVDPGS